MAGIYNRDNINYGSLIANVIANRKADLERKYEQRKANSDAWGKTIGQIGQIVGRGITDYVDEQDRQDQLDMMNKRYEDSVQYQKERDAKLNELLALRNKMLQDKEQIVPKDKPEEEPGIPTVNFSEQPTSTYGYQFNQQPVVPLVHELPTHNPTINKPILPSLGTYDDTPYRRAMKPSDFNEYLDLINYRGI